MIVTYIALFRGINVGGHQTVLMKELKELHESLGLKNVLTYIQSGNVVFTSENSDATQIEQQIEDGFASRFGFRVSVMVRTATELDEIIEKHPFRLQRNKESKWMTVLFLDEYPASASWEDLQQAYTGPEELCLLGKELHIYYTNGIGRSKLTSAFIEKRLKTCGTGRNLNTLLKLQTLALY